MRVNWWTFHKWLGLVVGLQGLAWATSGLFMSAVPIERVRGEQLIHTPSPPDLRAAARNAAPLGAALANLPTPVQGLELAAVDGQPVWLVLTPAGTLMLELRSGRVLPPLTAAAVRRIATTDYAGTGRVTSVLELRRHPPIEYRGPLPVWQVSFDGEEGMRLYVSPQTGKIVARRTNTWRIYDFLWSLHVMDYRGRENFNHFLLIAFAAGLLMLTLTGGVLVWRRFSPALRRLGR